MTKKSNLIPLFGTPEIPEREGEGEAVVPLPITVEEIEEVEKIVIETIRELELSGVEPVREATIGDWVVENCHELPVHEDEDGKVVVAVPIVVFDELVALVVDSITGYESMKQALEKIVGRGNELEGKIARDALEELNASEQKND